MLGIAKGHLLPEDLPEQPVVADDHLDRKALPRGGVGFGHQHGESSITDDRDALPSRVGELRRHRIREAGGHGGQVPGKVELPVTAEGEVSGRPGGDTVSTPQSMSRSINDSEAIFLMAAPRDGIEGLRPVHSRAGTRQTSVTGYRSGRYRGAMEELSSIQLISGANEMVFVTSTS